ncbi:MAG: phenylalanine--tRNA ligase subunit alpha [Alphaproteobacteria bacterium]|jgi:phenylalanyl-tRNA synthetase alpha chain|nr:phenylalanine--tRNA ligase subunit alpha [Alphaproteobacteria bacterium]
MQQDIEALEEELTGAITAAADAEALEAARVEALGRRGRITEMLKGLGAAAPDERRAMGQALNAAKGRLEATIEARRADLRALELEARLAGERLDVGLPVRPESEGRIHPVSQVTEEVIAVCADMGFSVAEGPDIEDDFHNFTALNIPPEHPARQMHDTFYFPADEAGEAMLLRTHTSPVQIRTMQAGPPPYRIIVPGRTYRCDSDQTHTPMFHQLEGLVVDEATHMGHLKGTLEEFCRAFFELDEVKMRFRPSHFPFTEPSAEVDIGCHRDGNQLRIGEGEDWMEILGSGMVHPNVLEACGVDSSRYQGFAWGMGIDRLAMLKYGIPDLRAFFDSDLRWLRHYGFVPLDVPTLAGGLSR